MADETKEGAAAGAAWAFDRALDTRGMACPLPVLKARKALMGMAPGARLLVLASDPMAAIDLPHFCNEAGHILVAESRSGTELRFLIERAKG
jgi:tRNA 2-thiouridine synthesizing protein A